MVAKVDPGLEAAFGGATRLLTMGALASASRPLTGYRVAQIISGQRTKVYSELSRLAKSGVVRRISAPPAPDTWLLQDQDLRSLLRKRVRISSLDDWFNVRDSQTSDVGSTLVSISELPQPNFKLITNSRSVRRTGELDRSATKDAILTRMGLPSSRRVRQRR